MILIIHGNDLTASRNFYFAEKNKLTNPVFINGDGITFDQVFQALENSTFFEEDKALIIENFFGKNKANSNEFKKIAEYTTKLNDKSNIIFWDDDEVSKTALTAFKNSTVKLFSYPQTMFTFLDTIKPGNGQNSIKLFHGLLNTMAPELVFFMIVRQFRIMLSAGSTKGKIEEIKRMAPWQLSKFKIQANYFNENKLLNSYNQLFEIEISQKTGKVPYQMEKSIDFFLLGL